MLRNKLAGAIAEKKLTVITPDGGVERVELAFQQNAGHVGRAVAACPASPRFGRCCAAPLHRPPSFAASG